MVNKSKLSPEEIKEIVVLRGMRLGFLIAALDIPSKDKEAWLALLPKMSLEQLDRVVDILEDLYAHQETKEIDKKLKEELENVRDMYTKQFEKLNTGAVEQIEELVSELEQREKKVVESE